MHAEPQHHLEFAADFRVGDWLVEPSIDRVSRNGTTLRLRPQLMDLLVVLAQHAGRTVSKDTILDTVWQGQHVAESGMTRCIAELRQALGDDAREPTMVQTIPKRGYRLVAPVEYVAAPETPDVHALSARSKAAGAVAREGLDAAYEPTADAAPPRRSQWRTGWVMGSALSVTLLLVLTWGGTGWSRAPMLAERDTVLLAEFTNMTGDSAFDNTLRLALAVNLGQAPFLHILPDDHVRTALTLSGRPASQLVVGPVALDICRREGAAVLLAGSIARLGTHYAIGIEATACRTGDSIGRELVEVERKEAVLAALDAAALRLRRRLGESRASLRQYGVPIIRATTSSLEALQAVTAGDVNRDHARGDEALQDYRRATDLDPQFALAWARRGAAAKALGLTDEAVPSFRKAYELRDRVSEPERFYILGHYLRLVADEPEKAVDIYRTWQRVYPGSAVPATNLASLFVNTFGRYDEALTDAREAVRLAPYSSLAARMLVLPSGAMASLAHSRQRRRRRTWSAICRGRPGRASGRGSRVRPSRTRRTDACPPWTGRATRPSRLRHWA
jgi:DNA-binding winged helix-turn-helix (wHTH) protein/tetratricopeptide (TPR) repeat protein